MLESNVMTLEQFRQTRRSVLDLAYEVEDESLVNTPGFAYCHGLYIYRCDDGRLVLPIGRTEIIGTLAELEPKLYDYAISEGIILAPPMTLEQFRATCKESDNLPRDSCDGGNGALTGYVYHAGLYICRTADGGLSVPLGQDEATGALEELEQKLYEFALFDGIITAPHNAASRSQPTQKAPPMPAPKMTVAAAREIIAAAMDAATGRFDYIDGEYDSFHGRAAAHPTNANYMKGWNDGSRKTIAQIMALAGLDDTAVDYLPESAALAYDNFKNWRADTHCGIECQKILDAAAPLLAASDVAAHPEIWQGIVSAMAVICLG